MNKIKLETKIYEWKMKNMCFCIVFLCILSTWITLRTFLSVLINGFPFSCRKTEWPIKNYYKFFRFEIFYSFGFWWFQNSVVYVIRFEGRNWKIHKNFKHWTFLRSLRDFYVYFISGPEKISNIHPSKIFKLFIQSYFPWKCEFILIFFATELCRIESGRYNSAHFLFYSFRKRRISILQTNHNLINPKHFLILISGCICKKNVLEKFGSLYI